MPVTVNLLMIYKFFLAISFSGGADSQAVPCDSAQMDVALRWLSERQLRWDGDGLVLGTGGCWASGELVVRHVPVPW